MKEEKHQKEPKPRRREILLCSAGMYGMVGLGVLAFYGLHVSTKPNNNIDRIIDNKVSIYYDGGQSKYHENVDRFTRDFLEKNGYNLKFQSSIRKNNVVSRDNLLVPYDTLVEKLKDFKPERN